jgi:hypothetical protein
MITASSPTGTHAQHNCTGCRGTKSAPLACVVDIGTHPAVTTRLVLCEECARDLANAVGFMAIRDGGWSKLEPRKRKASR